MNKKLVIVDGNSLMNRAYYAIQRPMITNEGIYTQGIYGFLNMLNKILTDYNPTHIAIAFDLKAPTFRHLEYSSYKAGRRKMPVELSMEFPILKDILKAMNISILEIEGFEADDIIGTVSSIAEGKDFETFIFTGDKDALQLASKTTKIIYTKRGITEFDIYDEDYFFEKYGFEPIQLIDLKGMMGDSSDNLPGIPGIGEKTGIKLILKYGNLEKLLESTNELKGKLKKNVEENIAQALMSKRLATINRNIPVNYNLDDFALKEPDFPKLIELYKKLEFNSFLKRLAALNIDISDSQYDEQDDGLEVNNQFTEIPLISGEIEIVKLEEQGEVLNILEYLKNVSYVWLQVFHDNNHLKIPDITSVCISDAKKIYVIKICKEIKFLLNDWISNYKGKICGHNLKRSYYGLMGGCNISPVKGNAYIFNTIYDTEIAEYLIDSQKKSYELSTLMLDYFHSNFPSDKEIYSQVARIDMFGDALTLHGELSRQIFEAASKILFRQSNILVENHLVELFNDIELPLVEVLASMEVTGMKADSDILFHIGQDFTRRIDELKQEIYNLAGEEFNINSPKQLGDILFEKLQLSHGKKNKNGYSTNAAVLESIKDESPIIPLVLEYRTLAKLKNTYVDGLIPLIGADGRIHAHFQQTVTATGRLSCTEPNLQNIPIRQGIGRQLRKIFIAHNGNTLVGADYSQIELRVIAHLSEDSSLIEAFTNNEDIHKSTAARVFDIKLDEVTPLQRSRAKAVNFGVIYGISAFGLSEDLKVPRKEAQNYIDEYFVKHPQVKAYMNRCIEECKKNGYAKTLLGRRRYINEINVGNYITRQFGERLAMNTPVQGSASDIIKIAMINVYHKLNVNNLEAKLILQVHDELILEAKENQINEASSLLVDTMENAIKLRVPLLVDIGIGKSWDNLK